MWLLIVSFILISGAGFAGMSRIVKYADSFGFAAAAGTAAAAGISIANGFGKLGLGWVSERLGRENTMIGAFMHVRPAADRVRGRRQRRQRDPVPRHRDRQHLLLGVAVLAVPRR